MRIYAAGRQWGKTTLLIRKSIGTGKTIVVPNEEMVRAIVMRADALRLTIPYPITFREFISKGQYDGAGYLIDELQSCLKQLNVTDATVDIEAVGYMQDPNDFIREKIYEPVEEPKQKESYSVAIKTSVFFDANHYISKLKAEGVLFTENYKSGNADILRTSNGGLIVLTDDLNWFTCGCRFDRMYGYDEVTKRRYTKAHIAVDYTEGPLWYICDQEKTSEKEKMAMNKPKRISKKEYYLNIAKAVAQRSTCIRRQYGAVIVKNDEIIATGYNGSARGEENCCDIGTCWRERNNIPHGQQYEKCVAVHAEQNAIISAPRDKLIGSTIYIYGEENGKAIEARPCEICHRMIINAGIENVVLSEPGDEKRFDRSVKDEKEAEDRPMSFVRKIAEQLVETGSRNMKVELKFSHEYAQNPKLVLTVNETFAGRAKLNAYRVTIDPLSDIEYLDELVANDVNRGLNRILNDRYAQK